MGALQAKHGGLCKPNIVFFGESLPEVFWEKLKEDFPECDLLLVMGTSLAVAPFSSLVNKVADNVPRCLINRDPVGMRDAKVPPTINKAALQTRGGDVIEIGTGFRFDN